ncbi:alpha-2-macroglobulin-like protein 1 [Willisornis vidua]|uniref:Alpha-2-macroglobulin-like protein 1 n=1 Tax=Willisornis vidua TaxID=1566151 RepID=A0ABQ9DE73_9PASS|nr:alpha-2-macroglobulin-like protein 1 [Willisornis vidua]
MPVKDAESPVAEIELYPLERNGSSDPLSQSQVIQGAPSELRAAEDVSNRMNVPNNSWWELCLTALQWGSELELFPWYLGHFPEITPPICKGRKKWNMPVAPELDAALQVDYHKSRAENNTTVHGKLVLKFESEPVFRSSTLILASDLDYSLVPYGLFHGATTRHYLVVIPAALRYPSTQVACLHITCHEAKLQVNLVLERSAGHELLMQETTQKKKTFLCTKFWVAPPAEGTEEIATVRLTITGEGVNIEEHKKVLICETRNGTIIQTDKPIYTPRQTVKFRIVTLDEEFIARNDSISLFLQDPKNNQIEQWLNVVPQDGIADLSFQLSDEPLLGTYVINVTSVKAYGSFSVEEYVLPKFEVIFEAPNQIYALDTTFPLQVCGRYTQGKSVQGIVHVNLCQKIAPFLPSASKPDLCHKFSKQTDEAGCFSTNVSLSSFSRDFRYYQDSIVAEASLVEDATEVHVNASHKLLISRIGGMALFDDANSYYHAGEMYKGKIKVLDYQGKAQKHKEVVLVVSRGEHQFKQKFITGDSGTASFNLDTTAWNSTLVSLEVDYRIYEEDLEHGPKRVIFSYFVTGKRDIVSAGQKTVWVGLPKMLEGFFSIPLTFSSTYAPAPRLVVYVIFPNGKIIGDSAIFSVSMCFRNKVELGFSTPETLPGSQVGLHLTAAPGSTCAVWAVDQSTLLMKSGRELSSHLIYGLFPAVYNSRYPHQVSEDDRSCVFSDSDEPDVFTAFRNCFPSMGNGWHGKIGNPSGNKNVTVTVPDTITEWKAGMFCTGRNGFGFAPASSLLVFKPFLVELPLPSSVVQGETFNLKATVFNNLQQCMKIQVTLEEFAHFQLKPCKGCVYSSCLCAGETKTFQWSVTAEQLGIMNITLRTEAVATKELCGEEIPFVPKQGQKDTIIKLIQVQPEGVLVEKAHSSVLCPKKGDLMGTALQNLDHLVQMPHGCGEQNMVLFAPIVYVLQYLEKTRQLTPEIRERAARFLRKGKYNRPTLLLCLPLCPVVLDAYSPPTWNTQSPHSLHSDFTANTILSTDVLFFFPGYQTQLQYQHPDGSYSEFGTKDNYGNTWLTAFVVKCFVQAKPYIFLDKKTIEAALTWLEFHQLPSGCFRNEGQLVHTFMKGGVDGEIPLAAYITAAYLEAGATPESTVVRKALDCIAPSLPKAASTYTQALLAYTFALAKDSQHTQELLDMLDRKAIRAGPSPKRVFRYPVYELKVIYYLPSPDGQIYWSQTSSKFRHSTSPWSQPVSVDVELTAYILLALLSKPNVTESDLIIASGIVAWLTRQQNAHGGFASTQDTVVALQALAKYASLTHSTQGAAEVRVWSHGDAGRKFQVSYQNRLLVQEAALTEVPGKFLVQAHGSCCVFTRMVLKYNTLSPQDLASFALQVKTEPVNCTEGNTHSVTLFIDVRYNGKKSTSSMVILEVSLLTGFILAPGSGMSLQHSHSVRRTEKTQGGVAIYLDKLSHVSDTYVLHLEQEVEVTNLKPGYVRVYDYYNPEEQALADYNIFCI